MEPRCLLLGHCATPVSLLSLNKLKTHFIQMFSTRRPQFYWRNSSLTLKPKPYQVYFTNLDQANEAAQIARKHTGKTYYFVSKFVHGRGISALGVTALIRIINTQY